MRGEDRVGGESRSSLLDSNGLGLLDSRDTTSSSYLN